MNPLAAALRFFERRYGIALHWTLRSVPQPQQQMTTSMVIPPFHENIIGLAKWLWWDLVGAHVEFHYRLCSLPMSHDVCVIRFYRYCVAFRRAGASFQLGDIQRSRWHIVRLRLPFLAGVWRGGWINEYMGQPPIEDIAPGCAKPFWYEPR